MAHIYGKILQTITSLLPSDKDVVNFSLVCKEIWERVLATNSTIWRRRFSDKYDTPRDRTAIELMWEYQIRAIVLPQKIDFGQRTSERHNFWLELIQTLIHEVLTLPAEIEDSKTYSILHQVMTTSNFLNHPKRDLPSELFCAVQLVSPSNLCESDPHLTNNSSALLVSDTSCTGLVYYLVLYSIRL